MSQRNLSPGGAITLGLLAAAAVIACAWPLLGCRHATLGGTTTWWLEDDPMISMRYARNLSRGLGLVWNRGEYVEGYTNLLWTLYMALIHAVGVPDRLTSLAVLSTNLLLLCATLPVLALLVRTLGGSPLAIAVACFAYGLNREVVERALGGFEVTLQALLATATAYEICRTAGRSPTVRTAALLAVLTLVRADAVVLVAGLALAWLALSSQPLRVARLLLAVAAVAVAQEAFRLAYYGDWLPNTAHLKVVNWHGRWRAGGRWVLSFLSSYGLYVALALAAFAQRSRTARWLSLTALSFLAYTAAVGGDFVGFRLFLPALPLLIAVSVSRIDAFKPAFLKPVAWIALLVTAQSLLWQEAESCDATIASDRRGFVEMGLLVAQNSAERSSLALFAAGSAGYFADRPAIDLLGKTNERIARLPARDDGGVPGHNKFDIRNSLTARKPDLVIAAFKLPVSDTAMRAASVGDFAFVGSLYFDPVFRRHCLAHAVPLDTVRTVFACDWSPESRHLAEWRSLERSPTQVAGGATAPTPSSLGDADRERLRQLGYAPYSEEEIQSPRSGVVVHDRRAQPGYNLISNSFLCVAELIDMDGRVIQSWSQDNCQFWENVRLLPGGDLLLTGVDEFDKTTRDYIERSYAMRLAWNGEVRWKRYVRTHHDIDLLPDGRFITLTTRYRRLPEVDANVDVVEHSLAVLSPAGELLEEVSLNDVLRSAPQLFALQPVAPMQRGDRPEIDLFHANSVEWFDRSDLAARDPIYRRGNILITVREQDTVAIVDWEHRKLVWAWGRGELSRPHNPSLLDNGNILIFDNGKQRGWTRIVEVDPLQRAIVWQYAAPVPRDFFSAERGSCQRLANGDTLIAESDRGRAFEVTASGEIVWEYLNPHLHAGKHRVTITRIRRYAPAFIATILAKAED